MEQTVLDLLYTQALALSLEGPQTMTPTSTSDNISLRIGAFAR